MFQLQPHVHINTHRSDKVARLQIRIKDKQQQRTIQERENTQAYILSYWYGAFYSPDFTIRF